MRSGVSCDYVICAYLQRATLFRPFTVISCKTLRLAKTLLQVVELLHPPLHLLVQSDLCFLQLTTFEVPKIKILPTWSSPDTCHLLIVGKVFRQIDQGSTNGGCEKRFADVIAVHSTAAVENDQREGAECDCAGCSPYAREAIVFGRAGIFVLSPRLCGFYVLSRRRVR